MGKKKQNSTPYLDNSCFQFSAVPTILFLGGCLLIGKLSGQSILEACLNSLELSQTLDFRSTTSDPHLLGTYNSSSADFGRQSPFLGICPDNRFWRLAYILVEIYSPEIKNFDGQLRIQLRIGYVLYAALQLQWVQRVEEEPRLARNAFDECPNSKVQRPLAYHITAAWYAHRKRNVCVS